MARWLLLVALAALGCAQGKPIPDGAVDLQPDSAAAQQALIGCVRVFSPAPELVEPAAEAAARWSAATGCDVHLGAGGFPVLSVPDLADPTTGAAVRGATYWYPVEIMIDAGLSSASTDTAVAHEMGHVLAWRHGHAASGLMQDRAATGSRVDETTLEFVCQNLPCTMFNPEDQ